MDKKLEEYYQARFDMFASEGWIQLIEDVENMIEATDHISSVKDEKTLFYRQGELSIMNWLKNLKEMTNAAYEGLKSEGDI